MAKLVLIDEMTISDHYQLDSDDKCFYYFNYTAQKGYSHSACNELILNFKKKVDRKGLQEYQHKINAINKIGGYLSNISQDSVNKSVFVPIPPSKTKANPLYDDRILLALQRGLLPKKADIRELVYQTVDTEESHNSAEKRDVRKLEAILAIDESLVDDMREYIVLVDDVLTTGCHFKAVKNILKARFPDATIIGLFIARREIVNDFPEFL